MNNSSDKGSGKLVLGMLILALSGIALGVLVGLVSTSWYLNNQVLSEMSNQGYILTDQADATSDDIVEGKTAYVDGKLVVGTKKVEDTSQATATSEKILEGKTAYVDGQLVTGTIGSLKNTVVMPSLQASNIAAGIYLASDYVIEGDGDLVSENIRPGVTIFGVAGRYVVEETPQEGENEGEEVDYD